jgi:hypothetical protein
MNQQLIFIKIPAIMASIEAIGKNRKNQSQGYSFRGIDDMYNELHTHFATHKVFYTPEVLTTHREEKPTKSGGLMQYVVLTVKYTFYAEDGSNVSCTMIGEASDSGDKASNKAMSTALKYALMEIFLIPTEEDKDTESQSPEFAAKKKPKPDEKKTPITNITLTENKPEVKKDLPWLNPDTKEWGDAVKRLTEQGTTFTLELLKKEFRIGGANENKLKALIK